MTAPTAGRAAIGGTMRVRVGKQVDSATRSLMQAYSAAWQATRDDLERAAILAEQQAVARGMAEVPAAYRTARLQTSLDALGAQLEGLATVTGVSVTKRAGTVVQVPGGVLDQLGRAEGVSFNLPADRALEQIVRRTTENVASARPMLTDLAEQELRTGLVAAVAGGTGPRSAASAIVRNCQQAFAGGMTRALNLTRTELIDASRRATTASYLANPGLVRGWRWVCAASPRTCPACWALHGTVHKPAEHQNGHQQCRCTQVPILATDEPGWDDVGDARDLFRKMPREHQLQAVGARRLELLDRGLPMQELAEVRDNAGWREAFYAKPLRDLPGAGDAVPLVPTAPFPTELPALSMPVTEPALPAILEPGTDLTTLADDELEALIGDERLYADDDLAARVMAELDSRPLVTDAAAAQAVETPASVAAYAEEQAAADAAWQDTWGPPPDARPAPRTAAQRAAAMREEYDLWVHSQWLQAEEVTRGNLTTRAARAAGIDDRSLFTGPHARAWKHASQELKEWWAENPRMTFTEWKHQQGYGGRTGAAAARRSREIRNLDSSL